MEAGYDVIGDIHGHADALCELLETLGYSTSRGVFSNPHRKAVFVGDYIDRGPQQREVLAIVRGMCAGGHALAIMGNHEFNALAWATLDENGEYCRLHDESNGSQHKVFLDQLREGSSAYEDALSWMRQLPIWLELDGIRIVHACWHRQSQDVLATCLDGNRRFTDRGFQAACRRGSPAFRAAEILLKGPELPLPRGLSFLDKDKNIRTAIRVRWWDKSATTYRAAALNAEWVDAALPDEPVDSEYFYSDHFPVFFGHYWLEGAPLLDSEFAACLDYSVARGGRLVAYRWSGERRLASGNFFFSMRDPVA